MGSGLAVLAVAVFYAAALPRVAQSISEEPSVTAGEPFEVVSGVEMVPVAGWAIDTQTSSLTRLTKDGATMTVVGPAPEGDADETIRSVVSALQVDPATHWQVGEPSTATTDQGDPVVTVEAHAATHAQQTWLVAHGDTGAAILGSAPDGLWVELGEEIATMVDSLVFEDAAG